MQSLEPGRFAGYKLGEIFGRLDCKSGMRTKKEKGSKDLFGALPEKLAGIDRVLRTIPIPRSIDFELRAKQIFENSDLEIFARICHAVNSWPPPK